MELEPHLRTGVRNAQAFLARPHRLSGHAALHRQWLLLIEVVGSGIQGQKVRLEATQELCEFVQYLTFSHQMLHLYKIYNLICGGIYLQS